MKPSMFYRAVLLSLTLALLVGCGANKQTSVPLRPVETVTVKTQPLAAGAGFSGEVRARHETDLAFRIGGKIIERKVDAGAMVRKGQVLARLDPQDAALSATAAKAQMTGAEADLSLAKAELERYRVLHEKNFVSRAVLDAKTTAHQAAQARLDQARAQAAVSRNQSGYTTLLADANGIITSVSAEPGQVVAAGQPVMRLARPNEKEVVINVAENRINEVRESAQAGIFLWANTNKNYPGIVREVAPSADPVTRTFQARVSILQPDLQVKLGMTAVVMFGGQKTVDSVLLPLTAVFQKEGRNQVWVVDPQTGQVAARAIEVSNYREDGVLVSAGLKDGEIVVARGVHKLIPGQTVRLMTTAVPPATVQSTNANKPVGAAN